MFSGIFQQVLATLQENFIGVILELFTSLLGGIFPGA
jgi:hypothetical protein